MFPTKTLVAVAAGMVVAGSVLVAPQVGAETTAGRAFTWGTNNLGQLGNDSTTDSSVPVAVNTTGVLAGRTVAAISAGLRHSCAVADGKAYCWGSNAYGQLGNDSNADSSVPVAVNTAGVLAGKTITAISAGRYHSCVVADGKAYCWGRNGFGQLGSTTTSSSVPVAVDTSGVLAGKTITAISAGAYHSCVVAHGKAYCWGFNGYGQLGDNTLTDDSPVPLAVDTSGPLAGRTVTHISAGFGHSCAVAEGRAYCWGEGGYGRLGSNSTNNIREPVPVDTSGELAGKTITAISAGRHHSCAVSDGKAYCWGSNGSGQLGNTTIPLESLVPVAVDTTGPLAGRTVTGISAGYFHSCVVAEGRAFCWGRNDNGQLGDGTTSFDSWVPVAVDTTGALVGKTVAAISAGDVHSAMLAAAAPQPPTAVSGAPGDGQVTVSWAAPADDGGSPILDYTVTAFPGGAGCTTSSTACVVSGLANGTGYTFTVTARNAIGTSAPSTPSAPVTPTSPAVTPTPPAVTPTAPPATPVKQTQTAKVKTPKKIKYKGKTVLLKKAVRTNAGQKAKSKVTVRPKKKKYAKVTTTKKGKVRIKTFGRKKLKVTLKLTAPATSEYSAFTYTKNWTVKKNSKRSADWAGPPRDGSGA